MTRLLLLLLLLPGLASADPLHVLIEGAHGGVSEPLPSLPVAAALTEALGPEWERTTADFGALRTDSGWVLSLTGGMGDLHRTFGAPPAEAAPVPVALADEWLLFAWPPEVGADLLPALLPLDPTAALRDGLAGVTPTTAHLSFQLPLPAVPVPTTDAEARLHLVHRRADGAQLHLVSRPRGEGARRVGLSRQHLPDALRLAAGDVVEGRSFLPGQLLSLQRAVSWSVYANGGLDALVPAHMELLAGLSNLQDEAAAAGVPLVSSNLFNGDLHAVQPYLVLERAGRRVLILGWTPPSCLAGLPPAGRGALSMKGVTAVEAALSQARATEGPFDLTILLGTGGPLPDLPGVDLAVTDFGGDRRQPLDWSAEPALLAARAGIPAVRRDPLPAPRLGAAMLAAFAFSWEGDALTSASARILPVTEDLRPDPAVRAEVQDRRQLVYVDREATLVPSPGRLTPPRGWRKGAVLADSLDAPGFAMLAGNLAIDRTGADIALLPPLPQPLEIDGDRSELVVDASLAVADHVARVAMTGLELRQIILSFPLVQAAPGASPPEADGAWIVGSEATAYPRWRGGKLGDGQMVLVAMTSGLLEDKRIASFISKAHVVETWTGEGWARRPSALGEPWPLRQLVRDGLVALREHDPSFGEVYARRAVPLTAELSGRVPSRLVIEIDDLNIGVTGSARFTPDTGYETSNEARAKLPNSLAAVARGRVALRWSDRIGEIQGFVAGTYSGTRVEDTEATVELADDLLAGVELQLRLGGAGQRLMKVPLSAYLQTVFDSEWSPADDPDDATLKLPRQQLLRTSAGINLGKVGLLKEAWFGGFIEADLAATSGVLSPGITAGLRTEKRWGALRWSNLVDTRAYFSTGEDTAADLSLRANVRTDLVVAPLRKLIPGFGVGGFIDALIFRGAIPGLNQKVGLHLLIGAELSYDAVIRPPVRLR